MSGDMRLPKRRKRPRWS